LIIVQLVNGEIIGEVGMENLSSRGFHWEVRGFDFYDFVIALIDYCPACQWRDHRRLW
jgi:hypothetical protein